MLKAGIDYVGVSTPFYCNDGKGNFLFHKRSVNCRDEHGRWDTGSGQLEFGLTPEENVLKEVLEEYGCKGKIQKALPPLSLFRTHNNIKTHWVIIPFFVLVNKSEVIINEPEKIDAIGWFRLNNLPSPLHTGFAYTIETLKQYFEDYLNL